MRAAGRCASICSHCWSGARCQARGYAISVDLKQVFGTKSESGKEEAQTIKPAMEGKAMRELPMAGQRKHEWEGLPQPDTRFKVINPAVQAARKGEDAVKKMEQQLKMMRLRGSTRGGTELKRTEKALEQAKMQQRVLEAEAAKAESQEAEEPPPPPPSPKEIQFDWQSIAQELAEAPRKADRIPVDEARMQQASYSKWEPGEFFLDCGITAKKAARKTVKIQQRSNNIVLAGVVTTSLAFAAYIGLHLCTQHATDDVG